MSNPKYRYTRKNNHFVLPTSLSLGIVLLSGSEYANLPIPKHAEKYLTSEVRSEVELSGGSTESYRYFLIQEFRRKLQEDPEYLKKAFQLVCTEGKLISPVGGMSVMYVSPEWLGLSNVFSYFLPLSVRIALAKAVQEDPVNPEWNRILFQEVYVLKNNEKSIREEARKFLNIVKGDPYLREYYAGIDTYYFRPSCVQKRYTPTIPKISPSTLACIVNTSLDPTERFSSREEVLRDLARYTPLLSERHKALIAVEGVESVRYYYDLFPSEFHPSIKFQITVFLCMLEGPGNKLWSYYTRFYARYIRNKPGRSGEHNPGLLSVEFRDMLNWYFHTLLKEEVELTQNEYRDIPITLIRLFRVPGYTMNYFGVDSASEYSSYVDGVPIREICIGNLYDGVYIYWMSLYPKYLAKTPLDTPKIGILHGSTPYTLDLGGRDSTLRVGMCLSGSGLVMQRVLSSELTPVIPDALLVLALFNIFMEEDIVQKRSDARFFRSFLGTKREGNICVSELSIRNMSEVYQDKEGTYRINTGVFYVNISEHKHILGELNKYKGLCPVSTGIADRAVRLQNVTHSPFPPLP